MEEPSTASHAVLSLSVVLLLDSVQAEVESVQESNLSEDEPFLSFARLVFSQILLSSLKFSRQCGAEEVHVPTQGQERRADVHPPFSRVLAAE